MKFAVDTNIFLSFFRPNPVNELISKSTLLGLFLYTSDKNIEELKRKKQDVLKYAKINSEQFDPLLSNLLRFIRLIPIESCKEFKSEAKKLAPHDKDIPIFALALKLNCPIWSNEPDFKKQYSIKVLSTRDMIELFT